LIIDIAHPIEISGVNETVVDYVFLAPKLEGYIEKNIRVFEIDFLE